MLAQWFIIFAYEFIKRAVKYEQNVCYIFVYNIWVVVVFSCSITAKIPRIDFNVLRCLDIKRWNFITQSITQEIEIIEINYLICDRKWLKHLSCFLSYVYLKNLTDILWYAIENLNKHSNFKKKRYFSKKELSKNSHWSFFDVRLPYWTWW